MLKVQTGPKPAKVQRNPMFMKLYDKKNWRLVQDTTINLDIISKLAIVGGFIFTGITFFITRKGLRHSEQVNMAHDISKQLAEAEDAVIDIPSEQAAYEALRRKRHLQYLNVWEWFAFLVNHKEIDDKELINHFKPALINDYKNILEHYMDIRNDKKAFEQIKTLYEK